MIPRRPLLHLAPPAGWCNDPNGLCFFKGRFHVFYQHNPHDTKWGPMHWAHASSLDLLHWTHHPIALKPTEPYETHPTGGGCFSGSAVVDGETLILIYTAHSFRDGEDYESQCLARSTDGMIFTKFSANPVLLPGRHPPGDLRDPKVWRHGNHWYMVLGTRDGRCSDSRGAVALFKSADLIHWQDCGYLCHTLGTMCECPDFFELDGRHVLIYSPIGSSPRQVMAVVGHFSYDTLRFDPIASHSMDLGPDFYASQTALDGIGRRVLIAWLGNWHTPMPASMRRERFAGAMTMPRVLSVVDDHVISEPIVPPGLSVIDRAGAAPQAFEVRATPGDAFSLRPLDADGLSVRVEAQGIDLVRPVTRNGITTPELSRVELPDGERVESVRAIVDRWSIEFIVNTRWCATFQLDFDPNDWTFATER